MAPKTEISNIRREELTQAALKCLAAKGYDRVTLDDVTKEAGLSKGIASYYFNTREDLLVSVIHKMWDNVMGLADRIWELPDKVDQERDVYNRVKKYYSDPGVDLVGVITNGVRFLVTWIDENPHIIKVVLEFWCQVPRNPMITKLNVSMHRFLASISAIVIQEGIKRGIFKKRDPMLAAYILISAITGLAFNNIINKGDFDTNKFERDVCNFIFGYLTT